MFEYCDNFELQLTLEIFNNNWIFDKKGELREVSEVKSDSSTTSKIFSTIKKAVDDCKSVSEPEKDDSTTVTGNTNAHSAIDNLIKLNKDVANAIEQASENIKKVGDSFEETDETIGSNISGTKGVD